MWHGNKEVLPMQDYGGFITLTMLKQTKQPIRCAATLAPIIDWSLYGKLGEVIGGKYPVTIIQLEGQFWGQRSPLVCVCCSLGILRAIPGLTIHPQQQVPGKQMTPPSLPVTVGLPCPH